MHGTADGTSPEVMNLHARGVQALGVTFWMPVDGPLKAAYLLGSFSLD